MTDDELQKCIESADAELTAAFGSIEEMEPDSDSGDLLGPLYRLAKDAGDKYTERAQPIPPHVQSALTSFSQRKPVRLARRLRLYLSSLLDELARLRGRNLGGAAIPVAAALLCTSVLALTLLSHHRAAAPTSAAEIQQHPHAPMINEPHKAGPSQGLPPSEPSTDQSMLLVVVDIICSTPKPSAATLPREWAIAEISSAADLYAFQFDIGFDYAIPATPLPISEGTFLQNAAAAFIPGAIDDITFDWGFTSSGSGVKEGAFVLATVTFSSGTGSLTIGAASQAGDSAVASAPEPATLPLFALAFPVLIALTRRENSARLVCVGAWLNHRSRNTRRHYIGSEGGCTRSRFSILATAEISRNEQ